MNSGSHFLTFPVYLMLALLFAGCPHPDPDPCPDPANPLCDDYNPCYPSDRGNDDISHIAGVNFSNGLTSLGIAHLFESYSGTHTDKIPERMATKMYPFFSENLAHE